MGEFHRGGTDMVFSDFHFYSEVLGIQTAAYVLMPEMDVMATQKKPLPCLCCASSTARR